MIAGICARKGSEQNGGKVTTMPTMEQLLARAREVAKPGGDDQAVIRGAKLLTLLEVLRGRDHALSRTLKDTINSLNTAKVNEYVLTRAVDGIALGLVSDLEAGLIPDIDLRIRSEVEGDFLGQAHRLLESHMKDPAAMLVGAVLEDSLRQLCRKHGVTEGSAIETMNEPLRTAGVYGLPQKQHVTAWAAIRNKADHGHFDQYTEPEVRLMYQGVAGFVTMYLRGD